MRKLKSYAAGGEQAQQEQMMQVVSQMLQQMEPQDVVQKLVEGNIPEETATQLVQQVMQMSQGQEQGQEQAPQQGGQEQGQGQDQQMQQVMQFVEQALQQGAQPADVAAQLLQSQIPPELIMEVFVQMGMPQEEAQRNIEQAMQGGGQQPQQQGPGEEQMEGPASNPQEEMMEGAPAPEQGEQPQFGRGGFLNHYANGGSVMEQVNEMIKNQVDPRTIIKTIQAAVSQGQLTPEEATKIVEQISAMQSASDPQGSNEEMTDQSQDPQAYDPNMSAPDQSMGMAKFGGKMKRNLVRAYGGPATAPAMDSENYAKDRSTMFVNSVKGDMYKATLDSSFPSLSGNTMDYGGLVKAGNGINLINGKVEIDPSQYETDADYRAAMWDWNNDPAHAKSQITPDMLTDKKWAAKEQKAKFQFMEGDRFGQDQGGGYVIRKDGTRVTMPEDVSANLYGNQGRQNPYDYRNPNVYGNQYGNQYGNNPVGYGNPYQQSPYDQLYAGASPFARLLAGNRYGDPRLAGSNLPGGMTPEQFLGTAGGFDKLTTGMTGKVGDQTWRVGAGEEFKEGSFWKGNRRKGIRYQIDWGNPSVMNANNTQQGEIPEMLKPPTQQVDPMSLQNAPGYNSNPLDHPLSKIALNKQIIESQLEDAKIKLANATENNETDVEDPYSNISPEGYLLTDESRRDIRRSNRNIRKEDDYKSDFNQKLDAATESGVSDEDNPYISYRKNNDRANFTNDKDYYKAMFPNLSRREIRKMDRRFDDGFDPYMDEPSKYTADDLERMDAVKLAQIEADAALEKEAASQTPEDTRKLQNSYQDAVRKNTLGQLKDESKILADQKKDESELQENYNKIDKKYDKVIADLDEEPTLSRKELREAARASEEAAKKPFNADEEAARKLNFKNVDNSRYRSEDPATEIFAYGGGTGECEPGEYWSDEEQACLPSSTNANLTDANSTNVNSSNNLVPVGPAVKPFNADVELGKFYANYLGNIEPTKITSNRLNFGYNNGATNYGADYNFANKSLTLQGKRNWAVGEGNGRVGVDASYTAPTPGMKNDVFSGGVTYTNQIGKSKTPLKVSFGINKQQQAYGGGVDPNALNNAINLINRAFGGGLSQFGPGGKTSEADIMKRGYSYPEDKPETLLNSYDNNGTVDASIGSKFNINWFDVDKAFEKRAPQLTNWANKVNELNPEAEKARFSALNVPRDEYSTMPQGIYGPQGDMLSDNIGNPVLNGTDTGYNNQRTIFRHGGRLYEMGGEYDDLSDDDVEELRKAGYKLSRI